MPTRRRSADDAAEPLVLRGRPRRVATSVSVHNATSGPVTVRAATVRSEQAGTATARLAAVLPAGTTGDVPVAVTLPATTPPGTYPAELEVAGTARPALLHVEPDVELTVSPHVVLAEGDGQAVSLRLSNEGNVAVPVARRLRTRLWCDGVVTDLDVGLDLDRSVTVEPGAAVDAEGRLVVPGGLDPTRRYRGRVPVGVADLTVLLLPTDSDGDAAAPAPTTRGATPRQTSRRSPVPSKEQS